ncbi:uncharacterized protein LOC107665084 [Sinocyclocheilus anshuiensis]|uniref:uncharacterized protein LOC107665084 n=1 Tax=Sinocyclocheilus anshuiensis TaxID=1608454 RepID=UPI0007B873F5|nr:PREDICTED: uncharacterized protein LOC107665084 [Sinocyclocheilus anshuiensis]
MANRLSFKTCSIDIRMILIIFLLPYPFLSDARQEKHFLRYKFTAFFKACTFPVFKAVGVCDGRQIAHYSNEERVWIRSSLTADNWIGRPAEPTKDYDSRDWFLHQLNTLSNCTDSQCSELHVLQRMIGCELEKLPDGTWIDKNPKAKETKKSFTSPDVRVFVKNAPDQSKLVLSCLATGFYPRDIEMYIRLDESVLVNQTSSGIRPNADGSFQMRTSVEIDANRTGIYDCLVIHSSLTQTQPIVTVWTIYQQKSSECLWSFIAGIIAAAVVIFLFVIGCCIYQKKKSYALMRSYSVKLE